MNTLDILKKDINNKYSSLADVKRNLYGEIKYLHDNFWDLSNYNVLDYARRIKFKADLIDDRYNSLQVMEEYYKLFKEEQDNMTGDFEEDKKEDFTLCIVKDGEVQKEVKVSIDEFIQIMHEQAEGETQ